jgi:hypothetical protein
VLFKGQCHCGAIGVELATDRQPSDQVLGACQCSFCRKHNARAFSDPKAHVTLRATDPQHLQRYSFGLKTSDQIICRRCGVYVAMTLTDGGRVWSVVNIDTLDDRALFTRTPEMREPRGGQAIRDEANRAIRHGPMIAVIAGSPSPASAEEMRWEVGAEEEGLGQANKSRQSRLRRLEGSWRPGRQLAARN